VLDGKRHSQGGISLGESGYEAEGGERMAIFSRGAESKYGSTISEFVDKANQGRLGDFLGKRTKIARPAQDFGRLLRAVATGNSIAAGTQQAIKNRPHFFVKGGDVVKLVGNKKTVNP